MIKVTDKQNCCGCGSCVQRCPVQCITMSTDDEGFLYPHADQETCIECGLCEKVCPVLNPFDPAKPFSVYAATNPNELIRRKSSSGGIFSLLAEEVLSDGGIVFGAAFDDKWQVHHISIDSSNKLESLRGSKYVQSRTGNSFVETESVLMSGRRVLYCGTPCQVSGLLHYLGKDYNNLLAVDIICHGVPSPGVWGKYLEYVFRPKGGDGKNTILTSLSESSSIEGISFRDKRNGWKQYDFVIRRSAACKDADQNAFSVVTSKYGESEWLRESASTNLYIKGFLKNLFLRPSCYACPTRCSRSKSDITLGDFWGVEKVFPQLNDDQGTSLMLVNSEKAAIIISKLGIKLYSATYEQALAGNVALVKNPMAPLQSSAFWKRYKLSGIDCLPSILKSMEPNGLKKLLISLKLTMRKYVSIPKKAST